MEKPFSFERALAGARRNGFDAGRDDDGRGCAPNVSAQIVLPSPREGAERARWEEAMAWATETAPPPAPVFKGSRAETTVDSFDELRLAGDLTEAQMKRLWREFVWRNHPDRQPVSARPSADARVASANALYDRARRGMRKG